MRLISCHSLLSCHPDGRERRAVPTLQMPRKIRIPQTSKEPILNVTNKGKHARHTSATVADAVQYYVALFASSHRRDDCTAHLSRLFFLSSSFSSYHYPLLIIEFFSHQGTVAEVGRNPSEDLAAASLRTRPSPPPTARRPSSTSRTHSSSS